MNDRFRHSHLPVQGVDRTPACGDTGLFRCEPHRAGNLLLQSQRTDTLPTPSFVTMRRGECSISGLTERMLCAAERSRPSQDFASSPPCGWCSFISRPLLRDAAPGFLDALTPVLNCGAQGVDLFFILSGFVLTWNYLDRMGGSWSTRATLHFLWLRLARVWPVYLVTLHLAALWVIFTLHVGHVPSQEIYRFTAISYVRQVLLVQLWFQPFFDDSSWDGPAWSISAEWLAYIAVRAAGAGDLPDGARDPGSQPDLAGGRRLAAPGGVAAGDRPVLHAVELAAAHRHAVHRRGAGRCRGQQVAARPIVAAALPAGRPYC